MLAKQVHHIDVLRTIGRPARYKNQGLTAAGFPIAQFDTVARFERFDLEIREVRQLRRQAIDFVRKCIVPAESSQRRLGCELVCRYSNKKAGKDYLRDSAGHR